MGLVNTQLSQCHAWIDPTEYSVQLARCTLSGTAGYRQEGTVQGRSENGCGQREGGREQGGGREEGR